MSAEERFGILISVMSLMVVILSGILRFLWKLSATLSDLAARIGSLEKAQDGAVTIRASRRHRKSE